jgi:hypothetical protein
VLQPKLGWIGISQLDCNESIEFESNNGTAEVEVKLQLSRISENLSNMLCKAPYYGESKLKSAFSLCTVANFNQSKTRKIQLNDKN